MSEKRSYNLTCQKCTSAFAVELYESVNVLKDPELKEQLMLNQINAVECPTCHFKFRVDKPLLYADPEQRLLIYLLPVADENFEEGEDQFRAWMQDMGKILPDDLPSPEIHLVFSRTELIERLFMAEAGLNDRIIEYIKYGIYTKNGQKIPPVAKALLFDAQDSTDDHLCFVVQDRATRKLEAVLQYPRSTYVALKEMFDSEEKSTDLLEMFPGPYVSARALLLRELRTEKLAPGDTSAQD
jgi:hypothetical protein